MKKTSIRRVIAIAMTSLMVTSGLANVTHAGMHANAITATQASMYANEVTTAQANIQADTTTDGSDTIIWGDSNCDEKVDMADAVLILQVMANSDKYGLGKPEGITEKGLVQADVYQNGDGVSPKDALAIQKYMVELITELPESYSNTTATTTTRTNESKTTTTSSKQTTSTIITETSTSSQTGKATTTTTTPTSEIEYINNVLEKVCAKDVEVPPYEEDLYEDRDHVFLFEKEGINYAYTMLSDPEDPKTAAELFQNATKIKGLHIWVYTGNQTVPKLSDPLPDTTGRTFKFLSMKNYLDIVDYDYNLMEWESFDTSSVCAFVYDIIHDPGPDLTNIARYDYNLSGTTDEEDVVIMAKYWTANPERVLIWINHRALERYIKYMDRLRHTNVALLCTSKVGPVEYAYNIPVSDLKDKQNEEYTDESQKVDGKVQMHLIMPIQVLPQEMFDEVSTQVKDDYTHANKSYTVSDITDGPFYIAYSMFGDYWAKIAKENSKMWWFGAGYYVFCLDDQGNYIKEWIRR